MDRTQLISNVRSNLAGLGRGSLGVPVLLLAMLAMMTLPIPPFLLDVLFTFNIALSIVVLLVCVYALRPLDFAVFPTILLVATLLRLALNVASTRVVLLHGHDGHGAAGKVIQAFGEVVIGGNYVVGVVVFAILMIINFVVVTKGAGRISEVSARFTLDAMPGKQMAIDADLNAGLIEQEEAKKRRSEVAQEADFYGSMDGASKFVRGDAIAGLLILFINLIGGVAIGMIQHSMSFGDAGKVYALLTIGDGLVAQLPSLLLSTAAAIMVTRVSSSEDMGQQVNRQMFASPKALAISAAILIAMGAVPGMPHVSFIGLGALAGAAAYWIWHRQNKAKQVAEQEVQRQQELLPAQRAQEVKELGWDDVTPVDMVGLEVGYRLIPLVDRNQGGQLLARIKALLRRAQFTQVRGGDVLAFEDWRLDTVSHRLFHEDGEEFFLSGADFALLKLFLDHPQQILDRDTIANATRGREVLPLERIVDMAVSRLRQRLRDTGKAPRLIQTVRGQGWRLAAP